MKPCWETFLFCSSQHFSLSQSRTLEAFQGPSTLPVLIPSMIQGNHQMCCPICRALIKPSKSTEAQPYKELKPIKRILVPLIPEPTLSQQHAVEAGYLFKEHASISAWLFTFLSYCEVTKPLSRIKTITRMRRIYKRRLVIAGFIISGFKSGLFNSIAIINYYSNKFQQLFHEGTLS